MISLTELEKVRYYEIIHRKVNKPYINNNRLSIEEGTYQIIRLHFYLNIRTVGPFTFTTQPPVRDYYFKLPEQEYDFHTLKYILYNHIMGQ